MDDTTDPRNWLLILGVLALVPLSAFLGLVVLPWLRRRR